MGAVVAATNLQDAAKQDDENRRLGVRVRWSEQQAIVLHQMIGRLPSPLSTAADRIDDALRPAILYIGKFSAENQVPVEYLLEGIKIVYEQHTASLAKGKEIAAEKEKTDPAIEVNPAAAQ